MGYISEPIHAIVNRLNRQYFLPAIQREFVWLQPQIIELFDSVMRGYPIGSFLLWELKPENKDKWDVYKFVENFQPDVTHNEIAGTDGVQQLTLVLHGQQRLNALLIGLKGSYVAKKKYLKWNDPAAWVKQFLYLDLFKDSRNEGSNEEIGLRYGFQFFDNPPENDLQHYWWKVGKILDYDDNDKFLDYLLPRTQQDLCPRWTAQ